MADKEVTGLKILVAWKASAIAPKLRCMNCREWIKPRANMVGCMVIKEHGHAEAGPAPELAYFCEDCFFVLTGGMKFH